jgi:hypothetical protein
MSVSLPSLSLVNSDAPIVYSDIRAITYDHFNRDAKLAYLLRILNLVSCACQALLYLFCWQKT